MDHSRALMHSIELACVNCTLLLRAQSDRSSGSMIKQLSQYMLSMVNTLQCHEASEKATRAASGAAVDRIESPCHVWSAHCHCGHTAACYSTPCVCHSCLCCCSCSLLPPNDVHPRVCLHQWREVAHLELECSCAECRLHLLVLEEAKIALMLRGGAIRLLLSQRAEA